VLEDHPPKCPTLNLCQTYLGSIDELICQALSYGLDVPEGSLTGTCAQQPDGLESTGKGQTRLAEESSSSNLEDLNIGCHHRQETRR
jgi:hypothetical protein